MFNFKRKITVLKSLIVPHVFLSKAELEITHKITISDLMYNQIVSILSCQIKKYLKVKNDYSILKYINLLNQCINDISEVKSSHVNAYSLP